MAVQEMIDAYAFGPFVLHLRSRLLYRTGLPVYTHAKVFESLCCLVLNSGRLVTKDMLVQQVWDGAPIGDNNIAQHMHLVREVLDDLAKPYRYIETVHGRGYRLVVEPHPVVIGAPDAQAIATVNAGAESLAYELVSNAAFFVSMGTPAGLDSGADLCRRALQVYPCLASAYAGIAASEILKGIFLFAPAVQQFAAARINASKALELEPECARAHIAMAALALLDEHAPAKAHRYLDAAAAIAPDMPDTSILRIATLSAQGDHRWACDVASEAMRLHPASTALTAYGAFATYQSGDLEAAAAALERLLIFRPGAAFATYLLGLTRLSQGHYARARDAFIELLGGRVSLVPSYEKFRVRATAALAFIEARTGSLESAQALARDVQRRQNSSAVALALARAGAREEDSVIACLQRAREQRDPAFPFVAHDPAFREYREIPEFADIVRM